MRTLGDLLSSPEITVPPDVRAFLAEAERILNEDYFMVEQKFRSFISCEIKPGYTEARDEALSRYIRTIQEAYISADEDGVVHIYGRDITKDPGHEKNKLAKSFFNAVMKLG